MIKIDVISGFLGAGKTTLIKKLFESAYETEKICLIENEFGEIGVDSSFLKESGIQIKEINEGCICCSLVGNFEKSLKELIQKYSPDRIVIEPSGVGKLSEVVSAIEKVDEDIKINIVCTVVDGGKCKMYYKNFGEFYVDQIREANVILVSKTDKLSNEKANSACEFIREFNKNATLITSPVFELDGKLLLKNLENGGLSIDELLKELKEKHAERHHEHHHEHGENCTCGCHGHEHEHHGEHCEHEHEHHHEHGENCTCGCHGHEHEHHGEHCENEHEHHHDHHEHHHADEVFQSWGKETPASYSQAELDGILAELCTDKFGFILRAKGVLKASDSDKWLYFDLVAGDYEIRLGEPEVIGKVCVIGSNLNEQKITDLFNN